MPLPHAALALSILPFAQATSAPASERPTAARRPNVVFILADDLGWGEVGCYGQTKIRTPNIDRIAAEGMRFTQAYSGSPVCAPSRCVLLTGRHTGRAIVRANWENGGWGEDEPEGQFPLPEGTPNLARSLQAAGYATAAVGKWGLGGPESTGHPNRQGFDLFYGYLCQRKAHNYYPTHLWRNDQKDVLEGNPYFKAHQKLKEPLAAPADYEARYTAKHYAPDRMIAAALEFVRANEEQPFFLYYASPIPHAAIQVPSEDTDRYPAEWDAAPYLGQKGYLPHRAPRAGYAALVSRFDANVGKLLDLLDELELAEDTLVMFSSDNGPTFNGGTDSEFFASAGPFRGLKTTVLEGGLRVPLIARWPNEIAPGTVSQHITAFQDVLPTVLAVADVEFEADLDGLSFAPTLLGTGEQDRHDALYFEYNGQQALRAGKWKAVRRKLKKGDAKIALYDLDTDPGESVDRASDEPEVVARLAALMEREHVPSPDFPLPTIDK